MSINVIALFNYNILFLTSPPSVVQGVGDIEDGKSILSYLFESFFCK